MVATMNTHATHLTTKAVPKGTDLPASSLAFYRDVLETLNRANLPFLVGGAYSLNCYTAISRHTKDFDIFIERKDYERIAQALSNAGYKTELTYPHWLGKAYCNGDTIDLVFSSGNGVAAVDQQWFEHSIPAEIFGVKVELCPPEESFWSKAYIMERERFDGADIAHLILSQGQRMDWKRLLERFGDHWHLLLSHLVLFTFIYPAHRNVVPAWVMDDLLNRLQEERKTPAPENKLCNGPLLSREQYLNDIHHWGYEDARLEPNGKMTKWDALHWTEAIREKWDG